MTTLQFYFNSSSLKSFLLALMLENKNYVSTFVVNIFVLVGKPCKLKNRNCSDRKHSFAKKIEVKDFSGFLHYFKKYTYPN